MPTENREAAESLPPTRERIWLTLDRDVAEHFRASGRLWNQTVNDILVEHMGRGRASSTGKVRE